MTSGQSSTGRRPSTDGDGLPNQQEVADILRLLGTGASGPILMALGGGPLRTKELTERVPGYAPRTVYRYVSKLVELGVIEREEEPGVPSKVVHNLSPSGLSLFELVDSYANASIERLGDGGIGAHSWSFLALLADLWESGMFEALDPGPATATELARMDHGLSFHQVSRRISLFVIGGVIRETQDSGRRRRYALTEQARRAMALVVGIGRWRRRHLIESGAPGLTAAEVAGVLRLTLPLVALSDHAGKSLKMSVVEPDHPRGDDGELVWAVVEPDGRVVASAGVPEADGWGRGRIEAWVDSLLDGPHNGLKLGGDAAVIKSCLGNLHEVLWKRREPAVSPAPSGSS